MTTPQKESRRQESGLAKRYGGTVTPGSGNGWVKKNDVRTRDVSFEAKYTEKKQFTLKQADLHTAERNALIDGRDSVFVVSFGGEEWAVIREADYAAYLAYMTDRKSPPVGPAEPEGCANEECPRNAHGPCYVQPMLPGADAW